VFSLHRHAQQVGKGTGEIVALKQEG